MFLLSFIVWSLGWMLFPAEREVELPEWERLAIAYGEGDAEMECVYREFFHEVDQRRQLDEIYQWAYMVSEVIPHTEMHVRERILEGLAAEPHQTDTVSNDSKNKRENRGEKKGKHCFKFDKSRLEGVCAQLGNYQTSYTFVGALESKDDQLVDSFEFAGCVTEKDKAEGKVKEKLQQFWRDYPEHFFCDSTAKGHNHILATAIEYQNDKFLKYLMKLNYEEIKTMDLSKASPIKPGDNNPYTILDYVEIKRQESEVEKNKATSNVEKEHFQMKMDIYDRYIRELKKIGVQKLR